MAPFSPRDEKYGFIAIFCRLRERTSAPVSTPFDKSSKNGRTRHLLLFTTGPRGLDPRVISRYYALPGIVIHCRGFARLRSSDTSHHRPSCNGPPSFSPLWKRGVTIRGSQDGILSHFHVCIRSFRVDVYLEYCKRDVMLFNLLDWKCL